MALAADRHRDRVDTLVDALARDPAVDDEPVPADVARDRAERDIARRRADLDRRRAAVGGDRGGDRKRVVEGKSVSVRVDPGGRRIIKKNKERITTRHHAVTTQDRLMTDST